VEGTTPAPGSAAVLTSSGCASCGAALRAGAPWCTLCLTPAAAAPVPPLACPPPVAAAPPPAPDLRADALTAPLEQVLGGPAPTPPPGWPCTSCGWLNPLEVTACGACGSAFLGKLAADDAPSFVLPFIGNVCGLGGAQHLLLAGAVVVGAVLLVVLLSVLGLLLP
jgi:hypothetical protein